MQADRTTPSKSIPQSGFQDGLALAILIEIGTLLGILVSPPLCDEPAELEDWRTLSDGMIHGADCDCCEPAGVGGLRDHIGDYQELLAASVASPLPPVHIAARLAELLGVPAEIAA